MHACASVRLSLLFLHTHLFEALLAGLPVDARGLDPLIVTAVEIDPVHIPQGAILVLVEELYLPPVFLLSIVDRQFVLAFHLLVAVRGQGAGGRGQGAGGRAWGVGRRA